MKDLLFLVHRIPYPPDKGDKIRSFHQLRYLSSRFRLHLGAFIDSPEDWLYADALRSYCASQCLLPLSPWRGKLRSLRGFLSGEALTVPYYRDPRMAVWARDVVVQHRPDAVLAFSAAMAQYAEPLKIRHRVLDLVDVDSQKWDQYADMRGWPANWVYRREGVRLLAFERQMAQRFDACLFVSKAEAALFARLAPESAGRIYALENGVDADYFEGKGQYPNPYPGHCPVLVFTGAMDYWPNVDGVVWFAREVFPKVLEMRPDTLFYIVGSRPHGAVLKLQDQQGVRVTGRVEDVRPYLSHATLVLAPLRVARGLQNKVLEAMAMGRHLLASPQAMEGIEAESGLDVRIATSVCDWVSAVEAALSHAGVRPDSTANRDFVLKHYDWTHHLAKLEAYLGG